MALTSESQKRDFWISYNKADRQWAEWIAWQLEEAGYSTIIQAWDFRPGANFVLEMDRAAKTAARTIPVLSPDYLAANYPQPEWAAAFAKDATGTDRILVPVRVRDCDVDGILGQVVYVDLVDVAQNDATDRLLAGVQLGRSKPATPPRFPGYQPERRALQPNRYPGNQPPVWNVPHLRNPNFTGREDLLRSLWETFESSTPTCSIQVIHGRGGIGKTRAAVEFAFSHASNYDVVWWIRADASATLATDLAAMASALGLPDGNQSDQARVIESVHRSLGQLNSWLLIFDNAEDTNSLQPFLPPVNSGHVLITSQNPSWLGLGTPLAVAPLSIASGAQFLMKRSGDQHAEAAVALASDLGGLPLALEQAGAYSETTGCGLTQYRDLFKEQERELLSVGPTPVDYPHTVATTWDLGFRRVRESSGLAVQLLEVAAFLAPTKMLASDLHTGSTDLTDELGCAISNDLAFHQMIAALRRYSLLDVETDGFAVHPLVQAVTRSRLDYESEAAAANYATELVCWAFPEDPEKPENWPKCERLLPHALASSGHMRRLGVASQTAAALMTNVGGYLMTRAQFAEAKDFFQWSLNMTEANVAPDAPELALRLNNLGSAFDALNERQAARTCFERAIELLESAGSEHRDSLGKSVSNLGGVLKDQGDVDGALKRFRQALQIHQEVLGKDHPTTAVDLNNIGALHRDRQEWSLAFPFLDEAAKTLRSTVGQNDPRYAMAASSLGVVLFNLGRTKDARRYLEDAVRIGIEIHGENHPDVVWFSLLLANFLEAIGDVKNARLSANQALRISKNVHGQGHRLTREAIVLSNRLLQADRDFRIQRRPL